MPPSPRSVDEQNVTVVQKTLPKPNNARWRTICYLTDFGFERMPPNFTKTLLCSAALALGALRAASSQAEDFQGATHMLPFEEEVIHYSDQTPNDPVSALQQKIDSGALTLRWDEKFGYLPAVLEALGISKTSQTLVFSKTSLQRSYISPATPRALFFNDSSYVGYIPGAPQMEISTTDPKLGGVFYALPQEKSATPRFYRDSDCMRCHASARTMGVPGHVIRSIGTDETGEIDSQTEIEDIDHCTPLADRWAGWYVTGRHGSQLHRGNLVGRAALDRQKAEPNYLGNITDLSKLFDISPYPARTSDICALMILEHQTHMHNYITRLNYESQMMLASYGHIRYLKHQSDAFLRYLLFTEEAPLSEPVTGDPEFASEFVSKGPRDHLGRSLRDLDMQTRMFRHPCSYLIYSEDFDSLPAPIRDYLLQRLYDILTGKDKDPQFSRITAEDRNDILAILCETKPSLPKYWQSGKNVTKS